MLEGVTFSLILPVYNVEPFLKRCLDSIFSQSCETFEVICINDGSTDKSLSILCEYEKSHSNLFVIDQSNQGLGAARNAGVDIAKGHYLWFIDTDDWIEEDALSTLNDVISTSHPDVILFNFYKVVDGVKTKVKNCVNFSSCSNISVENYISEVLLGNGKFFAWAKVFNRQKFLSSNFYFPAGWYEDVSLLKFFYLTKPRIYLETAYLYNYNIRQGSIMRSFDDRVLDIVKVYYDLLDFFKKVHKFDNELVVFYFHSLFSIINSKVVAADRSIKESLVSQLLLSEAVTILKQRVINNKCVSSRRKLKFLLLQVRVAWARPGLRGGLNDQRSIIKNVEFSSEREHDNKL